MEHSITKEELKEMIVGSPGTHAVTLLTSTVPKLIKPYPLGEVIKFARVNGLINVNYANAVNNRRSKEGVEEIFEPSSRLWGQRIGKSSIIEHKGESYVELKVQASCGYFFTDPKGIVLDTSLVTQFLAKPSSTPKQALEKEVIVRDYKISNIRAITFKGKEFEIK